MLLVNYEWIDWNGLQHKTTTQGVCANDTDLLIRERI